MTLGSRCCRGARARLAGLVLRRTPRVPSLPSVVSLVVKMAAAAYGPAATWGFRGLGGLVGRTRLAEAGPAASTPKNQRVIPAAAAAAAVCVAVIGVVASITIDGDELGMLLLDLWERGLRFGGEASQYNRSRFKSRILVLICNFTL